MAKAISGYAGKVALITGAASGIGSALARALADRGAIVVVTDIDGVVAQSLARDLTATGAQAIASTLDVADEQLFRQVVELAVATYGRLDLLINNAGIGITGELHDLRPDDWRQIRAVNLDGVVLGSMLAYQLMVRQGGGQIINVASMAAVFPYPLHTLYAATKQAVLGFSTTLRLEAHAHGVRVNVVCPGPVDTPIFQTTRLVGIDRQQALAAFRYWRMPPAAAAEAILARAAVDEAVIICPSRYRWLWRAARWVPWVLEPALKKLTRQWRSCRVEAAKTDAG